MPSRADPAIDLDAAARYLLGITPPEAADVDYEAVKRATPTSGHRCRSAARVLLLAGEAPPA